MPGAQLVTASGRAAELAVPLSIAVRIEPDLIRAMRLAVLPYLDVAAESDLWFSDLVAARGPDSIIFEPEILPALRGRLAEWLAHSQPTDPVRAVWDIVNRIHASTSPALLLEERVAWLAISAGDSGVPAIEEELRTALYSLLREGRTGIADWFAGAWGRLPDIARNTGAARQLLQAASRYIAVADVQPGLISAGMGVAESGAPPRAKASAAREEGPRLETKVPAPGFHAVPPYIGSAPFTGRATDLTTLDEWGRSADPVMVVEAIGGTGKSALTWQWAQERAPAVIPGLSGRLWWSFYEGSASMTSFLQELLAYTSGRPMQTIRQLRRSALADEALATLRSRPYLVVLDGFERLLAAYHRFDPSKLRGEEAEPDKRSLIDPWAEEIVHRLAAAGPSKILISTRLMPTALQGRFGQRMPGVWQLRLPGLTDADTRALLDRLDVHGSEPAIASFFGPLGNHPLLVGIVAGMVRDYRAEPGGFDRWLADPEAGSALRLPELSLVQRRTHILTAALDRLEPGARRLLGWISVLAGKVSWATLEAINPFQPEPPGPIESDLAAWRSSEPVLRATAQLNATLKDLEERGLLLWDRSSNSYDLHPIIRAYAYDQLEAADMIQANDQIREYFQALPPEDPDRAASTEDLSQTIIIFRILTSVGHLDEADLLWSAGLSRALLVNLGAYATVTELLAPVANDGTLGTRNMRADLAIGYHYLNQYDRAISQETSRLAEMLRDEAAQPIRTSLLNLGAFHRSAGAYVAALRYSDLRASLNTAVGIEGDGSLYLNRAALAAYQGQTGPAHQLLDQAKDLGPDSSSPWFEDDIEYFPLYLALVADQSVTHAQLDGAAARARSWALRRNIAGLRAELFVRQGQLEQALAAAQEYEQLGRDASLGVVPAQRAFLLARLGRVSEAEAAVEESLTRLRRVHPAERPYLYLARALWELGRPTEAASQARDAYRQAWGDGPPHCRYWDLRYARELLQTMGEAVPDLPRINPATLTVSLEEQVRTFIAAQQSRTRP
jgi:hypothetical protein